MLESDTRAAAEQALKDAFASDDAPNVPEQTAPEQAPVSPEPSVASEGQQDGATPDKPSGLFYDVDPNTLTPEMRQMFDGMQKAFTNRMQEVAPLAKAVDTFGGVDQVQEALGFVESLSDPENLVQLHGQLSEYLQAEGLTKDEADQVASQAVTEQSQAGEEDYGFEDPREKEIQKELEELRSWREEIEEERLQTQIELGLERQEAAIRNANPHYSDDDLERIYRYAYAFGGDLDAAQSAYEADRQAMLASYAAAKESVPVSTAPPTPNAGAVEADSFGSDFDKAHDYAKRVLASRQTAGDF